MRRAPGWTRLAGIALELGALAFIAYVLMGREREKPLDFAQGRSIPHDDTEVSEMPTSHPDASIPQHRAASKDPEPVEGSSLSQPIDFITDSADESARYYRAAADDVELLAGFYSDGRLRLADTQNRRFAGMLQGSHADLLELGNNQWSEVFVRVTPTGRMQLELRGGPYDARVLTCEQMSK